MKGTNDLMGIMGGFLFLAKIVVHWYLIYSITGEAAIISRYGFSGVKYILPVMQKVDEKHQPLKLIANVLYCLSLVLIVIFLIGV